MNIFEQAAKLKLRVESDRGLLTVEQLWDISLTDLDTLARGINMALKSYGEESFIHTKTSTKEVQLKLQLDLLKHIIGAKLEARELAEKREQNSAKRKTLLQALESKENEELNSMSKEDILKQLEEL